jgi:hypothetical protein
MKYAGTSIGLNLILGLEELLDLYSLLKEWTSRGV